ncbi:MAG: transposase [Candidatus Promineifilaceae bacterium]
MRRKEKPTAGNYYHIYNRGVNFQKIFFIRENWFFFLRQLRSYCTADYAEIIAYCLMPNHYHMLVYLKTDNFGKEVMQPFMVSYSKAINNQEKRVGPLFQGPYQAKSVPTEGYLLHLTRYIHLNPVTAEIVVRPEDWEFSSYREYIGLRNGTLPKTDVILKNPVFDNSPVFNSPQQAYADYVCTPNDPRTGLVSSLLFDE